MATSSMQVGVTGGIGSGKSLVCKIFSTLGVPVYDADSRARYVMANDTILIQQIKEALGSDAYFRDGKINRKYIAELVFANDGRREKLNSLVHPKVKEDYLIWWRQQQAPYVIREAALIFEAGINKDLDKVIVVTAPESVRLKRVLARDSHRTREDIERIFQSQMPEEEKRSRADFIIVNDESQMIMPQVLHLHQLFVNGK